MVAVDDYRIYKSDKTRSTGSLTIIIIMCIFSSCTIGVVTTTTTTTTLNREYRKRRGGGRVASSGACPAPVSLACFYHSSVLFACVRVCRRRRCRSQWKRLAHRRDRPLVPIRPCKVSGARLMKTLYRVKRFAWDSITGGRLVEFISYNILYYFYSPFVSSTYRRRRRRIIYPRARVSIYK